MITLVNARLQRMDSRSISSGTLNQNSHQIASTLIERLTLVIFVILDGVKTKKENVLLIVLQLLKFAQVVRSLVGN